MSEVEEPALYRLTAYDAGERLRQMFEAAAARAPHRTAVAAALMLADAASQKITLEVFSALSAAEPGGDADRMPPQVLLEKIERLVKFYFDGKPMRLDSVLWDAEGYIFGWSTDQKGLPHLDFGSFPQTVEMLAEQLRTLAAHIADWRELLEEHAVNLERLLANSRDHARQVAQQRVTSQGWLSRLRKPKSVSNEMLSLGFAE